jgi:mRNA interferase RelE/StbE
VTYRVVIAPSAARQLHEKLPEAVAWACFEFIRGPLAAEPRRVGAPLRKPFEGQWRARRGSYRIRYTIDETAEVVHVLDVDAERIFAACSGNSDKSQASHGKP